MIAKAISLGVSKININTECQLVFAEATRKYIEAGKDQQGKGFDPASCWLPAQRPSRTSARRRSSCSAAQARAKQKLVS